MACFVLRSRQQEALKIHPSAQQTAVGWMLMFTRNSLAQGSLFAVMTSNFVCKPTLLRTANQNSWTMFVFASLSFI